MHQFLTEPAVAARGLTNYWGYNSIGFFAPHAAYASSATAASRSPSSSRWSRPSTRAGIEVILDVVYNHTAEGGARRADAVLPRARRPRLLPALRRPGDDAYWDVTGCGNTVDAADHGALRLILDSLRYWVTEMHVDGFRFDLTSALARTGHDVDMRGAFLTAIAARTRCCGT